MPKSPKSPRRLERTLEKAELMRTVQEEELRQRHEEAEREEKEKLVPKAMTLKGYKIMSDDDDEIASGTFSRIFKATFRNQDIVVKIIEKEDKDKSFLERTLPRMVKVLRILNSHHENIISVLDVFETEKRALIFMEAAVNGNLKEVVRKEPSHIPERFLKKFAREMALALCYLHINELAHRNIRLGIYDRSDLLDYHIANNRHIFPKKT